MQGVGADIPRMGDVDIHRRGVGATDVIAGSASDERFATRQVAHISSDVHANYTDSRPVTQTYPEENFKLHSRDAPFSGELLIERQWWGVAV